MLHTPAGVVFAPMKEGAVLSPEEFGKLPGGEQKRISAAIEELEEMLASVLRQVPRWEREVRNRIRELNREMTGYRLIKNLCYFMRRSTIQVFGVIWVY